MSDLICNVHEDIINKLDTMKDFVKSSIETLEWVKWDTEDKDLKDEIDRAISDIEDITYYISDCIDDITTAKDMGQKMEDRLREYHNVIESLGFKRDRGV